MSKVLQVEGSLQFDEEESSDSEDETENNLSNIAPLVFDSDGSDEEELEIFHNEKEKRKEQSHTLKVGISIHNLSLFSAYLTLHSNICKLSLCRPCQIRPLQQRKTKRYIMH